LLPSLDAAVYKHVILGLVFLKYVSNAFDERRAGLRVQFQGPGSDYFLDPADFGEGYTQALATELEIRDYYTKKTCFGYRLRHGGSHCGTAPSCR
jgi:type I restriction enzyme M protein